MGNVNCDLGGIFQGCCSKDQEELEDDCGKCVGNSNTAQATAGGDVVLGGNTGSVTINNQNNTGISAGVMNVKGNIFHGNQNAGITQQSQNLVHNNCTSESPAVH